MKEEIIGIFSDQNYLSTDGIFFSGLNYEGEFKQWYHSDTQVWRHCFFKNDNYFGEYREYFTDGTITKIKFYPIGDEEDLGIMLTSENIDKIKKRYPQGPWIKD